MDPSSLPYPDNDRGSQLIAGFWSMCAIAIVTVALRFWGRILIRQVAVDDYIMLFTLVLFIVLSGLIQHYVDIGGTRHLVYLSPVEAMQAIKWNWIVQPFALIGFATGKLSVALLILRIMSPSAVWQKWTIWIVTGICIIMNVLQCIFTFAQCNPPRALWMPALLATGQAKCWNPKVQSSFGIFVGSWNVLTDVVLCIIPITILYKLNMKMGQRIALCSLLSLSLVAAIAGSIKINFLADLNQRSDLTWETYNLFIWSGAELFVIIVCGSIPPIRPLYDRMFCQTKAPSKGCSKESWSANADRELGLRPLNNATACRYSIAEDSRANSTQSGTITKHTDISITHGQ